MNIKEIIENLEKTRDQKEIERYVNNREELGLTKKELFQIISLSTNPEYIKQCITDRIQLKIGQVYLPRLIIETKDPDYIKHCINNRKTFDIDTDMLPELIIATKDSQYIKKCIDNRENFEIDLSYNLNLIIATRDSEYILQCIKDRKKLGLEEDDIEYIITNYKDLEFTQKCIDNREKYGLTSNNIASIMISTLKPDQIKQYIVDSKKYGIETKDLSRLMIASDDQNILKQCILDRLKYNLENEDLGNILKSIKDNDFITQCIADRKKLKLTQEELCQFIIAVKEPEMIKQYIANNEELDLDDSQVTKIVLNSFDDNGIKEYIDEKGKNKRLREINLPENLTIGIEIECVGKNASEIKQKENILGWECKDDGSLKSLDRNEQGVEVVSPILTGPNKETTKQIYQIGNFLQLMGQYANKTCGGHIHIGADYLKSPQAYRNLLELWGNTEEIMYIISNEKGSIPRSGTIKYATPLSKRIVSALKDKSVRLEDENDLDELKKILMTNVQKDDRYQGINFINLEQGGINTIEFRLANGTVDPNVWIENVNLFGGVIVASEKVAEIQEKNEENRTEEENKYLNLFDKVVSQKIKKSEKLNAMLQLCIQDEEARNIYRERFECNNRKIKLNPITYIGLKMNVAKNIVKIGKKELGKNIFTGENSVEGVTYGEVEKFIENEQRVANRDTKE